MTAFTTPEGLIRQTRLPMNATNSVTQFVRVGNSILKAQISEKCRLFFYDIGVKGATSTFNNKKTLPEIRRYIF